MIDKNDHAFLNQNIKGLMMTLIAAWNGKMDAARADTEFANIRPADIRVFAQLRGRDVKLSDIHKEMGFSRQAAQQAVDRLVAQDMLRIRPVPGNMRDKEVVITEKGQRWRAIAAAHIRSLEAEIAAVIGEDGLRALRGYLSSLAADATGHAPSASG